MFHLPPFRLIRPRVKVSEITLDLSMLFSCRALSKYQIDEEIFAILRTTCQSGRGLVFTENRNVNCHDQSHSWKSQDCCQLLQGEAGAKIEQKTKSIIRCCFDVKC